MKFNISLLTDLPTLSTELLEVLDQKYPLFNPSEDATLREIDRAAGARDVVEFLHFLKRKGETPSDEL